MACAWSARTPELTAELLLTPGAAPLWLQVRAPNEFQGNIIGDINRRKGLIQNSEAEALDVVVQAHVPLSDMFGYSTGLRSMTQGKGEFTMVGCWVVRHWCLSLRKWPKACLSLALSSCLKPHCSLMHVCASLCHSRPST